MKKLILGLSFALIMAASVVYATSPIVDVVDAFEFPSQYECPNMSTPTECGQTRFFYLGYTADQFCYWHGFGGSSSPLYYGGTVSMGYGNWYQVWAGADCEEF